MPSIRSALRDLRRQAGLQQQDLAARVGVSRQSLSAIEAGETVPSTTLALQLARALDCRVEDLFALAGTDEALTVSVAPPLGATVSPWPSAGSRVRIGLVRGGWVAHPLEGDTPSAANTPADGIMTRAPRRGAPTVKPLRDVQALGQNLLVAGCDPALGLLAGHLLEGPSRIRLHWIEAASESALDVLAAGQVHIAGLHLTDAATGEQNLPAVRRHFGDRPMVVVNLATWQQGFVVARTAARRFRRASDLVARGVRVVLREPGSGARTLFDRVLADGGIPPSRIAAAETVFGHHAVARSVAHGTATVGIATAAAAASFGLDFVPLAEDRFDLVMYAETAQAPSGQRLIEALSSTRFRRDIGALRGYGTTQTGKIIGRMA